MIKPRFRNQRGGQNPFSGGARARRGKPVVGRRPASAAVRTSSRFRLIIIRLISRGDNRAGNVLRREAEGILRGSCCRTTSGCVAGDNRPHRSSQLHAAKWNRSEVEAISPVCRSHGKQCRKVVNDVTPTAAFPTLNVVSGQICLPHPSPLCHVHISPARFLPPPPVRRRGLTLIINK